MKFSPAVSAAALSILSTLSVNAYAESIDNIQLAMLDTNVTQQHINVTASTTEALKTDTKASLKDLAAQADDQLISVSFADGSAWIHPKHFPHIQAVAEQLDRFHKEKITMLMMVTGSTGKDLSVVEAKRLSELRAERLKEKIISYAPSLEKLIDVKAIGINPIADKAKAQAAALTVKY